MDDHAERVCAPLKATWLDVQLGEATLLDLARLAEQASTALDNASAPLPQLLMEAAGDLEYAHYATEAAEHQEAARRMLSPIMARLDA